MSNEIEIKKGNSNLIFEGITNISELNQAVDEKVSIYQNIEISESNIKQCKEIITELKPARTEIKKFRAEVNKNLKLALENKIKEIDCVIDKISVIIEPLESKIDEYAEKKRLERLQQKKDKFEPILKQINDEMSEMKIPFFTIPVFQFDEKWINKKDDDISFEIDQNTKNLINEIKQKQERIKNIELQCQILRNQYDIISTINYMTLEEKIYSDDYAEKLEKMAGHIQAQEIRIKEEAEQAKQREILRKEQQHQEELERKAQESIRAKKQIEDNERKQKQELEQQQEKHRQEIEKLKQEEIRKAQEIEQAKQREIENEKKRQKKVYRLEIECSELNFQITERFFNEYNIKLLRSKEITQESK
jgi:DNA repair exonuclease SbcCD ATPase subunit